jgi:anaerobic magnesium-protoporphyrin IX monomethyl ester cyclase
MMTPPHVATKTSIDNQTESGEWLPNASSLLIVTPPAQPGYTNERDQNATVGVSRKLKPREKWRPNQPSLSILYLAGAAQHLGMNVQLADLMLEGLSGAEALEFLSGQLRSLEGQVWIAVGLSLPSLPLDLAFANSVKARFPQAIVFGVGGAIMGSYRHWIDQCRLDFIVYGEPEAVMPDVFQASDWRKAPGIIVVSEYEPDGRDPYDPATAVDYLNWRRSGNVSSLERPAWHLVPLERYTDSGRASDAVGVVQASMGCPIGCTMCTYTMVQGKPLRTSDAVRVVDEIDHLRRTYGITRIRFEDPNFSYDRKLMKEIIRELKMRDMHVDAAAELSLEMLDRPTLEDMNEVGIRTILTGVETNDSDCMKSIGQNIKVNPLIKQRMEWCDEIGLKVYGFFLIGAPEESWSSLKRTIAFAKQLRCEATMTLMTPFPGTPLYWRALREGLLPKEMVYEKWGSYTATVRSYHLSLTELQRGRIWARLETIIPYRLAMARKQGRKQWLKTGARLAPHMALCQALRAYVWWRSTAPMAWQRPEPTKGNAELSS